MSMTHPGLVVADDALSDLLQGCGVTLHPLPLPFARPKRHLALYAEEQQAHHSHSMHVILVAAQGA